ncbi:MAG: GNAT family protein [Actinomycetota bacterium]
MSDDARADHALSVGPRVDTTLAIPPGSEPLIGRWVRLGPPSGALAARLFSATHGSAEAEAVWTYLPYGPFSGEVAMAAWLDGLAGSSDPLFLAVTLADGGPVGVVSYLNVATADRRIEIGHIWYVPGAQRTRANTETAYLLLRHAFEDLGYRRVEWKCDALNARSRAAATRLGFTFEGVFRQHMVVKGRNRDTAWFSMLDTEWPQVREAIERWFDAEPGTRSLGALTAG